MNLIESKRHMRSARCAFWRLVICSLATLVLLAPFRSVTANELTVQGVGEVRYEGSAPDAQARQKALNAAKADAVDNYVIELRSRGDFPPYRYRLYLDQKDSMARSIDRYVHDVAVVEEAIEASTHRYRIRIRATVDQAEFDRATSYSVH